MNKKLMDYFKLQYRRIGWEGRAANHQRKQYIKEYWRVKP